MGPKEAKRLEVSLEGLRGTWILPFPSACLSVFASWKLLPYHDVLPCQGLRTKEPGATDYRLQKHGPKQHFQVYWLRHLVIGMQIPQSSLCWQPSSNTLCLTAQEGDKKVAFQQNIKSLLHRAGPAPMRTGERLLFQTMMRTNCEPDPAPWEDGDLYKGNSAFPGPLKLTSAPPPPSGS